MGHTVGLELKAQMGLDIPLSYISPPLIHARLSGMNQGLQGVITIREAQQVDIGRLRNSLMRPQRACCI